MVYYASYATYCKICIGWVLCLSMTELAIGVNMLKVFHVEREVIKLDKYRSWTRFCCFTLVALTISTIVTFTIVYQDNF